MQVTLFSLQKPWKIKKKILELVGSKGLESQRQKNENNIRRVGSRTVQKQDRSMWSLWKKSDGQFIAHDT